MFFHGRLCTAISSNMKKMRTKFLFLTNKNGVSIIGTLFTLIILGVLGAALVSLVSMEQESRMRSLRREYSFYAVQAGLEYALREIKEGGYPIITAKSLGNATFTNTIIPSERKITVVGASLDNSRTHSITTTQLASDCASMDTSGVSVGGTSSDRIQNVSVTKSCLNSVNVQSMSVSWSPDIGEKVTEVRISGTVVYSDVNGVPSGGTIDIQDTKFSSSIDIEYIDFNSSVAGKSVTIQLNFTDSSTISKTFSLP